ncbi:MAG: TonB-dependent receptor [Chitinophagales bacterium]|nr:TonB-dependent receptor [Chitinophagales bacterium]
MLRRVSGYIIILISLFNTNLTHAQKVSGRILDSLSHQIQPGVQVQLLNTDHTVYSNGLGNFVFYNVQPGTYTLSTSFNDKQSILQSFNVANEDVYLGDVVILINTEIFNEITVIDLDDLAGIENENDNFSSVLSAGRDPFLNAANYNLGAGRFRPRGYSNEESEMNLNGMVMNNQDDGRVLWTAWNSLNDVMKSRTNIINLNAGDFTFGGIGDASYIDLRASAIRPTKKITYSNSNRTFQHRIMGTYATGMMKNGWGFAISGSHSYADQGYVKGTYLQANSYFLSIDRKLGQNHLLNFLILGSPQKRGRSTGAIQEMYDLAGSNYYNPNWGYQDGKVRNSREYIIHQPISMLRHDWKISPKTHVTTTIGYQFGNYGSTRLDWYEAPDPRPDYYRRLPSYATNSELKDLITNYYTSSEAHRQLNWAELYEANSTRNYTIQNVNGIPGNDITGKLAAYVQESENYDKNKFNFNSVINSTLADNLSFAGGIQYLKEKVHYYRRIEDLLGADFYIDFNKFAERDYPSNPDAAQNDLNNPNRIVREGDIYGYNYYIHNQRQTAWGQLTFKTNKMDYVAGLSLAHQSFYRAGKTKVGLFPDNSFGKSEEQTFFNYGVKLGATYKLDGRNYFLASGSYRTRAPFANESFVSPRVRDQVAKDLTNEKITAFDISYLARYTNFKARVSAFYTQYQDKITNDVFYHEDFRTFVNYLMTGIDTRHTGVEVGFEYSVNSKVDVNGAFSLGEYYYTSRPKATISRDNSAEDIVTDRVVYIENYYVSGTPQVAGTVGVSYRSSKYWTFNLNVNGFSSNYLSFNPDRRTEEGVKDVYAYGESTLFHTIIDEVKLKDNFTVDAGIGKSIRFPNRSYLRINLNIGNLLNNKNFITGGFEQYRYDFENKNIDKFPPRYFYAYGLNYTLGIAYLFP